MMKVNPGRSIYELNHVVICWEKRVDVCLILVDIKLYINMFAYIHKLSSPKIYNNEPKNVQKDTGWNVVFNTQIPAYTNTHPHFASTSSITNTLFPSLQICRDLKFSDNSIKIGLKIIYFIYI